jgi:hypothetical protein
MSLVLGLTGLAVGTSDQLEPLHMAERSGPMAMQNVGDKHDTAELAVFEVVVGMTDQDEPFHTSSRVGPVAFGPSWEPTATQKVAVVQETPLRKSADS